MYGRPNFLPLLVCCFLTALPAFSQSEFTLGAIVVPKGDTLPGWIRLNDELSAGLKIEFRESEKGETRELDPLQTPWVRVSGQWYAGKIVTLDVAPHRLDQLTEDKSPVLRQDTLFLLALALGRADLFYTVDLNNKPHFLLGKDSVEAGELILRQYLSRENGREQVVSLERYKGQLDYFLSDCPEIKKDIRKTRFTRDELTALIRRYNMLMSPQSGYVVPESRTRLRFDWGLTAGISSTMLSISTTPDDVISKASFGASAKPTIGFSIITSFPRGNRHWSLFTEVASWSYEVKDVVIVEHNPGYTEDYAYDLSFNYLHSTWAARFQAVRGRVRPFGYAGLDLGQLVILKNELTIYQHFYTQESTRVTKAISSGVDGFQFGLNLGAGLVWRRWSLDCRYGRGNGFSTRDILRARTNTIKLLAGYRF